MDALDFNSVGKESRVEDKPRTLSLEPDLLVASKQCLVSVMGIQTNQKVNKRVIVLQSQLITMFVLLLSSIAQTPVLDVIIME